MKHLRKIEKATKDYFFHNIPVVGNGELLEKIAMVLVCDWNGNVVGIVDSLDSIVLSNFEPRDKGRPGIFGCNNDGLVIASITLYKGERQSLDPKEHNQHFAVWSTKSTGW